MQTKTAIDLTPLLAAAVGGVLTILGGWANSRWSESRRWHQERTALTGALVAEVSALMEITKTRGYIEGVRAEIQHAKANLNPNKPPYFFFSSRKNTFAVYEANLGKLGVLRAPLPKLSVQFYTQVNAIMEDIKDMEEGKRRVGEDAVRHLEQLLSLFENTMALGQQIIDVSQK